MKKFILILLSLLLCFALVACAGGTAEETPAPAESEASATEKAAETVTTPATDEKNGGRLNIGIIADPDTLNPLVSTDTIGSWIIGNMYPSLLVMDKEANKVPYLAKEITTSEDGLTVTLTIHEGLSWTDGEPVTVEDVMFSAQTLFDQNLKYGNLFTGVTMEMVDDYTLVYTLPEPNAVFITKYGFWTRVVPEHIFSAYDDQKQFQNFEDMVAFGPWILANSERGQFYSLEVVEDFGFAAGRDRAYLDQLIYRIYPDVNTMALALKGGEIDVTGSPLSHTQAAEFEAMEDFNTEKIMSLGYAYMEFNLRNPIFSDINLKTAFSHAIDRDAIVAIGLSGDGMTLESPVNPQWESIHNKDAMLPEFSPEKAMTVLDENGYVDTDGDGIRNVPNGDNLSFKVKYAGNYLTHKNAAEIIKSNMADVGIEVIPAPLEKTTWSQEVFRNKDFELAIGKWGIIDPLNDSLYALFNSINDTEMGLNAPGLHDDRIDEYTLDVRRAVNFEQQKEAIYKLQEVFVEVQAVIPLFVEGYNFAYNDKFGGWEAYPSDLKGIMDRSCLVNVYEK